MRKINVFIRLACIIFLWFALPDEVIFAQGKPTPANGTSDVGFELRDGDRVVFLGNSLFENELKHGYLELALTTRWPNAAVTYRNIGWNGDTVWGEARTYVSPPSGYDLLLEQLAKCQPTIVFIAYGSIESEKGEAGLPRFVEGLNALLNAIDRLGAKPVLLSPLPLLTTGEGIVKRNSTLKLYSGSIAKTADERNVKFIDIFTPILEKNKQIELSENGIHLNETGYYYLAHIIETGLGLEPRMESVSIDLSEPAVKTAHHLTILDADKNKGNLIFSINQVCLPLPVPDAPNETAHAAPVVKINGLKKGYYTLIAEGAQIATASGGKWGEGVKITQGPYVEQSERLRDLILKKNELFFHQYRPPNKTYILGFRSHEQGRHAEGLEDLSIIITWLEGQIALHRAPGAKVFQLTPIKEQGTKRNKL